MQAVGVVVDPAEQRVAAVDGLVVVRAGVQRPVVVDLVGVVDVGVVLLPDVLQFGGVQAAGEALDAAPGAAQPAEMMAVAVARQFAVVRAEATVATLVVVLGETDLASREGQVLETVVGQAHTAEGLRQHARLAAGDHRVAEELVAQLQLGVEGADLQRRPATGELIGRLAGFVAFLARRGDRQDAGAAGTAAAVELQPEHAVGVDAEADHAGRVAGLKGGDEALRPFLAVVPGSVPAVMVEVVVAGQQLEAGAFDEAFFGFPLIGPGGGRGAQRQRHRRQGEQIPHCGCSFLQRGEIRQGRKACCGVVPGDASAGVARAIAPMGRPAGRNPKKKAAGISGLEKTSNRSNQSSASGSLASVFPDTGNRLERSRTLLLKVSSTHQALGFPRPALAWRDR